MKATAIKKDPTVTVVIPTRNRAKLVKRAVTSVLNQSFKDLEIIVVDDASNDHTEQVLKNFNDSRIHHIFLKERSGPGCARNIGAKRARGQYLAFLDDDDEWSSNKLEKQVEKLSKSPSNVAVVYCGYKAVYKGEAFYEVYPEWKGDISKILLEKCCIGSPTPLIRRDCLERVGYFDITLRSCEDWDLWIRLSMKYIFDFIPEILAVYHIHGDQISVNIKSNIVGRESIISKYYKVLKRHPKTLSWHYRRLGTLNCIAGNYRKGLKYFLSSLASYPFNGGTYIHLFLFLFSRSLHRQLAYRYGIRKVGDVTIVD